MLGDALSLYQVHSLTADSPLFGDGPLLAALAALRDEGCSWLLHVGTRAVVLVAAGAVQQEQGGARGRGLRGQEDVRSIEAGVPAHGTSTSSCSGGRLAAICSRLGSSHGGSLRCRPSSSSGSSTSKPGESVAISNSTPPGSRK